MRKHRSLIAWFAFVLLAAPLLACNFSQQIVQETSTPSPTSTATLTATSTPRPTYTPRPTATPNLAATEKYEEFLSLVEKYHDAKLIRSTDGAYHQLPDYSDALAQANYYSWATVGQSALNFILKSHVKMSTEGEFSASTGCGFVFSTLGDEAEALYVKQGGSVFYLSNSTIQFKEYYRTFSNPAEFELILLVNQGWIRAYVDGNRALEYRTFKSSIPGDLGFTVTSGSDENASQCEFTNSELWVIK